MQNENGAGIKRQNPIVRGIKTYFQLHTGTLIGLIVLCIVVSFGSENFFTVDNIVNIFRQNTINGMIAVGMSLVILIGGVDLSVGSVCAAGGLLVVTLVETMNVPLPLAIIAALVMGMITGAINGMFVAYTTLPYFIITLAMQMTMRGVAYFIPAGYPIISNNEALNSFGNGNFDLSLFGIEFQLPYPVILMAVVYLIFTTLLNQTRFGRHVYAIGGNKEAAIHSGINVKRIQVIIFMISGFMASMTGIVLTSRMLSGQPSAGEGYEGEAIAASVLGGVSFGGGYGTLGGTLIGVLILGVINNGMNMLRLEFYYQQIAKGLVILFAVYFDSIKDTLGENIRKKLGMKKKSVPGS